MPNIEKYVNDQGKVAVLISPCFGGGWSTWNDREYRDFLLFDCRLVELAQEKATQSQVEKYIKSTGMDARIFLSGWEDIEIHWMDEGTEFYVHEYDGSESLVFRADGELWITA